MEYGYEYGHPQEAIITNRPGPPPPPVAGGNPFGPPTPQPSTTNPFGPPTDPATTATAHIPRPNPSRGGILKRKTTPGGPGGGGHDPNPDQANFTEIWEPVNSGIGPPDNNPDPAPFQTLVGTGVAAGILGYGAIKGYMDIQNKRKPPLDTFVGFRPSPFTPYPPLYT